MDAVLGGDDGAQKAPALTEAGQQLDQVALRAPEPEMVREGEHPHALAGWRGRCPAPHRRLDVAHVRGGRLGVQLDPRHRVQRAVAALGHRAHVEGLVVVRQLPRGEHQLEATHGDVLGGGQRARPVLARHGHPRPAAGDAVDQHLHPAHGGGGPHHAPRHAQRPRAHRVAGQRLVHCSAGQRQARDLSRQPELPSPRDRRPHRAQALGELRTADQVPQQHVVLIAQRVGFGRGGGEELVAGDRVAGAVERHPALAIQVARWLAIAGDRMRGAGEQAAGRGERPAGGRSHTRAHAPGPTPHQGVDRPPHRRRERGASRGGGAQSAATRPSEPTQTGMSPAWCLSAPSSPATISAASRPTAE